MTVEYGNLLVLLPLFIALVVLVVQGFKALKIRPLTAAKDDLRVIGKGVVYILVALILVRVFLPTLGVVGTVFGLLFTIILAILVIVMVVDLPSPRMDAVHDLAWRDGPKTPIYSRSGKPVPYVRWARRFAMVALALFVALCGLAALFTASPTAPSASPVTVANTCGGPTPQVADSQTTIKFNTGKLQICHDNEWQTWAQIHPDTAPPTEVPLTAWTTEGKNGYGVVVINETPYLFWTTAWKQ